MKKNVEKILIILNLVLVAIPYSMYFTGIDMQSLHFIWAWIITFILGIIVEVFAKNSSSIAIILVHYMCAASGRSVVECCKTIFDHITKKKDGE